MKNIYWIFCVLLAIMFGEVIAQTINNNIYGIVLDKKTREPLPNVNIFIANTTWGTTSNIDGSFKISSIIPGNHEIVFSMIGYESHSQVYRLSDSSQIFFRIEMIPKVYEINEVNVSAYRPEQWLDDLEVFKEKFLGYSPSSFECKIVNEYNINFLHPRERILVAESDYPIEIVNYILGYNIKCEIQRFEYDEASRKCYYTYRLFFTELDTSDIEVKEKWESNRKKTYKKSLPFFLRTLIEDNILDEGFEISLVHRSGYIGRDIFYSSELIRKDSLSDTYELSFDDYLQVRQIRLQISRIKLNHLSVTIDKYGYSLGNNEISILGYWSKLGVASFLPKNYGFAK